MSLAISHISNIVLTAHKNPSDHFPMILLFVQYPQAVRSVAGYRHRPESGQWEAFHIHIRMEAVSIQTGRDDEAKSHLKALKLLCMVYKHWAQ